MGGLTPTGCMNGLMKECRINAATVACDAVDFLFRREAPEGRFCDIGVATLDRAGQSCVPVLVNPFICKISTLVGRQPIAKSLDGGRRTGVVKRSLHVYAIFLSVDPLPLAGRHAGDKRANDVVSPFADSSIKGSFL